MKHKIIMIALVAIMVVEISAITAMLLQQQTAAQSVAQPTVQIDYARQERVQAADHMIERVTNRIDRLTATCDRGRMLAPKEAEFCITELAKFRSTLPIIRAVAARGNETEWNKAVDIIHKFEADTEVQLVAMQRILR